MSKEHRPIGSTYAHWTILEHIERSTYRARCPHCPGEVVLNLSQMARQEGCKQCKAQRMERHKVALSMSFYRGVR